MDPCKFEEGGMKLRSWEVKNNCILIFFGILSFKWRSYFGKSPEYWITAIYQRQKSLKFIKRDGRSNQKVIHLMEEPFDNILNL